MARAGAAGAAGAFTLVVRGIAAATGRLVPPSGKPPGSAIAALGTKKRTASEPRSTASGASTRKGTRIGLAAEVPVGGAATFTDPAQGVHASVVQPTKGQFVASSHVCTHAGCTVEFDQAETALVCPCRGSALGTAAGAVLQGPSVTPLPKIRIAESASGLLCVDS